MQRTHRGSKPYKVQSTAIKGLPTEDLQKTYQNERSFLHHGTIFVGE